MKNGTQLMNIRLISININKEKIVEGRNCVPIDTGRREHGPYKFQTNLYLNTWCMFCRILAIQMAVVTESNTCQYDIFYLTSHISHIIVTKYFPF